MKKKKRAKRAKIEFVEIKKEYSKFTCPHCHVEQHGIGITRNITRFLCEQCGNEIIVEH